MIAIIIVAVAALVYSIVASSRPTPSGAVAPAKPKMQDEAMRRMRMGAGRPGGMQR